MKKLIPVFLMMISFSCAEKEKAIHTDESTSTYAANNHSYSNIHEINSTHIHLDLDVDFETKTIQGVARHTMNNKGTNKAIFDTKRLDIQKVTLGVDEIETTFSLGEYDSILGSPLVVDISEEDTLIHIYYSTHSESEALGWMDASLTHDKKYPFLYTQGEAILTRSWIPNQDLPENRITYSANVQVPVGMMAVMSATNPTETNDTGKYSFTMKQPVPSYLIALAVGELEFAPLDHMSGVYAEPDILEAAKQELQSIPQMIHSAEELYGAYLWERFDVLFLPYSFPFGGMENPRLTFATPTILAGDGSLLSLIAHELAHSWSGNLVTMANWDDFWLNEGFTVYFENRIMEKVEGKEIADMLMLINYQELEWTVNNFMNLGFEEETHLKLDLEGRDPDDGMTDIAYNKGAFFLMALEEAVGREVFDEFLLNYFNTHKFQSITTENFVKYLNEHLIEKNNVNFNVDEWIYGPGIPSNITKIESPRFAEIQELAIEIQQGAKLPKDLKREDKITQEWIAFIRAFQGNLSADKMRKIDEQLHFRDSDNSEIMTEWFVLGIKNEYTELRPDIEAFLTKVGRRKFLEPLYAAMRDQSEESREWALKVYQKARPNYHAISYLTIDKMLGL